MLMSLTIVACVQVLDMLQVILPKAGVLSPIEMLRFIFVEDIMVTVIVTRIIAP
jgi:hypothetical protein